MLCKKSFTAPVYLLALICISSAVKSQNNSLGSWNIINLQYYFNQKWNLWGEAQLRSQKLADQFFYHQLEGGLNYKPNKKISILISTGEYVTYSNGGNFKPPVLSYVYRLWEQLTLYSDIDRVKIENRYRIEQRWGSDGYVNIFRYRLNPIISINKSTNEKGTLYASIYDEVFLMSKEPYFQSNRVFGGLGYQFSNPFTLQIGWIRELDYLKNNTTSNKNFIQTTLSFRLNQHKIETRPSSRD